MSDIAFNPTLSTNEVFRANDRTRFLTNDLDTIESNIATLQTGKADTDHAHTGYAAVEHTHTASDVGAIPESLMFTSSAGSFKYSFTRDDNVDILNEIKNLSIGVHTIYSQSGVTNNPKTTEAWRFVVHKTGSAVLWVLGFGSFGSVYNNYYDGTSEWRGWHCLFDASPSPLWNHTSGAGGMYMTASQTVTPSKPLSQCRNGWLLLWSDYDADTSTINDADFVTTMIPKFNASGSAWDGKLFLCDVPRHYGGNTSDVTTEKRIIKAIYVHDTKLVGHAINNLDTRTDVVLRAVYEF